MTDLTVLANVRAYGNVATTDYGDSDLGALITRASALVRNYLGRDVLAGSYTESFDGPGGLSWLPRQWPLTGVTSLTIGTLTVPAAADTVQCGYRFNQDRIVLQGFRFIDGALNCTCSYSAGVAVVPDDIEQATILTVLDAYRSREREGSVRSESEPGVISAGYTPMALSQTVKDILNASPFCRRF